MAESWVNIPKDMASGLKTMPSAGEIVEYRAYDYEYKSLGRVLAMVKQRSAYKRSDKGAHVELDIIACENEYYYWWVFESGEIPTVAWHFFARDKGAKAEVLKTPQGYDEIVVNEFRVVKLQDLRNQSINWARRKFIADKVCAYLEKYFEPEHTEEHYEASLASDHEERPPCPAQSKPPRSILKNNDRHREAPRDDLFDGDGEQTPGREEEGQDPAEGLAAELKGLHRDLEQRAPGDKNSGPPVKPKKKEREGRPSAPKKLKIHENDNSDGVKLDKKEKKKDRDDSTDSSSTTTTTESSSTSSSNDSSSASSKKKKRNKKQEEQKGQEIEAGQKGQKEQEEQKGQDIQIVTAFCAGRERQRPGQEAR